jgi:hypothetical protein
MSTSALIEFVNWASDQDDLTPSKVMAKFRISKEVAARWLSALSASLGLHGGYHDFSRCPVPTRKRALKALLLKPMTSKELGRCLCIDYHWINIVMRESKEDGLISIVRRERALAGASRHVYALTPSGIKRAQEIQI